MGSMQREVRGQAVRDIEGGPTTQSTTGAGVVGELWGDPAAGNVRWQQEAKGEQSGLLLRRYQCPRL